MTQISLDYLIIGQGLAGSLLAWELMQRGYKVLVVDNGQESASQVAAGLINPITGMRLVKAAEVDQQLSMAKRYYQHLSTFFKQPFYIEKPMLRIFKSQAEVNYGLKRLQEPSYQAFIERINPSDAFFNTPVTQLGSLEQKQTGYLLTRNLLSCLKAFFIAQASYRQGSVSLDELQFQPELHWHGVYPKQIIFCDGHQAQHNPLFSWLPFQLVKGEILTLEYQGHLPDKILNFGDWLIPLNERHLRLGATFDRENVDTQPTETAKGALLNSLAQILPDLPPTRLASHQANIRPCTLDKLPFIGHHPQYSQLSIFNGFGAKGSLQIPIYAQQFAAALASNSPSPSNIQRYYATHFTG